MTLLGAKCDEFEFFCAKCDEVFLENVREDVDGLDSWCIAYDSWCIGHKWFRILVTIFFAGLAYAFLCFSSHTASATAKWRLKKHRNNQRKNNYKLIFCFNFIYTYDYYTLIILPFSLSISLPVEAEQLSSSGITACRIFQNLEKI